MYCRLGRDVKREIILTASRSEEVKSWYSLRRWYMVRVRHSRLIRIQRKLST